MTALPEALLDRYERFTEVLCLSAQYGADARREQTYAEIRDWVRANHDALDALLSTAAIGESLRQLFEPETLRELLERDGGELISNVGRISDALFQISE